MIADFPETVGPELRKLWLWFPKLALSLTMHYTDGKLTPASPRHRLMHTTLSWDSVQTGAGENLGGRQARQSLPILFNAGILHAVEVAFLMSDGHFFTCLLTFDKRQFISFFPPFLLHWGFGREGLILQLRQV